MYTHDSSRLAPVGTIKSRCRFNGASRAPILATLLAAWLVADRANWWRGLRAFDRAIDGHHCKRTAIVVLVDCNGYFMVGCSMIEIIWQATSDEWASSSPLLSSLVSRLSLITPVLDVPRGAFHTVSDLPLIWYFDNTETDNFVCMSLVSS